MKINFKILIGLSFLFFGITVKTYAQTPLDTLSNKLNANISVDEKLDAIKNATNWLILNNPDTLVYYCNYALKMCDTYKNEKEKLFFLSTLTETHFNLSNYSEALNNAFSAIKICEKTNDSLELANIYNSVGSIYRVSNKLEDAKIFFNNALHIRENLADSFGIASCYNNIGIIYMMESVYDTGMTYWGNSLRIKLAIGDSIGATTTMNNMAMYYRDIGETEKALDFFNQVLKIKKRINDHTSISMAYLNLGELFLKQNNQQKAEHYYLMALDEANLSKSKQLISWVHLTLAEMYYNVGQFKSAYDNFIIHSNMDDTIFSEETVKNLDIVESKYENEKKALLIENLEKEKSAQNAKQQLIVISASTGLIAMLVIIIIVTRNYRQKKKDNLLISKQKNILFEKNQEITDSISYARRLQEAILPPTNLIEEKLPSSFVVFLPKDVVSGDFYWLETINSDTVIFAVADCTGHGVPGAMVSVVCSNALNRAVKEFNLVSPSKILDKVRELVIETFEKSDEDVKDGMDIALCLLNTNTNVLKYAGANNPLWIARDGVDEIEEIKADKQPIGVYHENIPFKEHSIQLNQNDSIFLFSDGLADQFGGEKGKKLKYKPFKKLLLDNINQPLGKQKEILINNFNQWKGEMEQVDDVCVIGIRI